MNNVAVIHGYDYGTNRAARSPVALDEFRALEQTVGWTQTDSEALVMVGDVLAGQEEAIVDSWRAIIGQQEHLAKWFFGPDGKPDEAYRAAVRRRFVRWVADCAGVTAIRRGSITKSRSVSVIRQQKRIGPTERKRLMSFRCATS